MSDLKFSKNNIDNSAYTLNQNNFKINTVGTTSSSGILFQADWPNRVGTVDETDASLSQGTPFNWDHVLSNDIDTPLPMGLIAATGRGFPASYIKHHSLPGFNEQCFLTDLCWPLGNARGWNVDLLSLLLPL
jgi:hypothetical protein